MVAFPLSPAPSYYTVCSFPKRNGIFYVGDTPSIILSKSGTTGYTVRDYWGNSVSSGSVSGTTCTPTAPNGGWKPGWYRIYFTGTNTDSVFGPSYGATNFCVIRNDSRFPAVPSPGTYGGGGGESRDHLMKGVMGIGTSRLTIGNVTNLTAGSDSLTVCQTDAGVSNNYWTVTSNSPYYDAARPRYMTCHFPNIAYDSLSLPSAGGGSPGLVAYAKDGTIDGSKLFIATGAGSLSGYKILIYYPNSTTLVETWDNIASTTAAQVLINASSVYVRVFVPHTNAPGLGTLTATVLGNSYWQGVVSAVQSLYTLGVSRFEGPTNEPSLNAETAQQMCVFQAAVHAGNGSAVAIGPCPVDITNLTGWNLFLAAGGGNYCDEISFHDYNSMTNGDMNLGKTTIEAFLALLAKYGLQSKPLWQTEAGEAFNSVYGVYHPRRARVGLMHRLLWEQYGMPRERNPVWYDASHGFWSYPTWLENSDSSLNPQAVMYRVLAEETFGQVHNQKLDFGIIGNHIFLGSIYTASSGVSTAVIMAASYMQNATVTLSIAGTTSALTVVDGFGNTSSVTPVDGRVTVRVQDMPTYVRLPAGVTVTAYTCNDWPAVNKAGQGVSSSTLSSATFSSALNSVINDGGFMTNYGAGTGISIATTAVPDTAVLTWPTASRVDRVIIWCAPSWQAGSSLVDFDVQTTMDGATWTTQKTVTKSTPNSFQFGTDYNNVGCQYETYWDEQWIFDVKLPAPVTIKGLRLYVRATSYGGEPDANVIGMGQGNSQQTLALQEIACLCDDNTKPAYVYG